MGFTPNPDHRYRMPVVFGPAVGPRQRPGGGMWSLEETGTMNAEWMAITYRTDPEKLAALLPPGMSLRGEPLLSVSCAWFKNLYWLAGRGYGILSLDFPVTYQGKTETLDGSFCPVIWEGQPEAILTGRDEMGFPKLFCDMPEIAWDREKGTASCETSWFGFKFFDIALTDMVEDDAPPSLPGSGGGAAMYYKYVPRTNPRKGGWRRRRLCHHTGAAARRRASRRHQFRGLRLQAVEGQRQLQLAPRHVRAAPDYLSHRQHHCRPPMSRNRQNRDGRLFGPWHRCIRKQHPAGRTGDRVNRKKI